MGNALQRLAADVIGRAEEDPDNAVEILSEAAHQFRQVGEVDPKLKGALGNWAQQFEMRARQHEMGELEMRPRTTISMTGAKNTSVLGIMYT